MVKPALPLRYSGPLLSLALALASQPLHAQQAKPADDDRTESEEAVFIPVEYRPPPWQVSVGVRVTGKAKIKFSGLGSMPARNYPGPNPNATAAEKDTQEYKDALAYVAKYGRNYDNGYVGPNYSVDIDGNQIDPNDNKTNYWAFTSSDQVMIDPNNPNGHALAFANNSIRSGGATAEADSSKSVGWDVEISRELGATKRFSWGLIFGAGLSDLNAKTSGTVKSNLHTITDLYSFGGTKLTATTGSDGTVTYSPTKATGPYWYNPTETVQKKDANGNPVFYEQDATDGSYKKGDPVMISQVILGADGKAIVRWGDISVRLADTPFSRTETITEGIDVLGTWQVKGAFLTARFGPYIDMKLGEHFSARASAGITLTVLGARLLFEERYLHPILNQYMSIDTRSSTNEATITGTVGYFASGELQWHMTQRTGLFFGAIHESYARDLRLRIGEQVADIDVSAGTAFRTGFSTRF